MFSTKDPLNQLIRKDYPNDTPMHDPVYNSTEVVARSSRCDPLINS